MIGKFVRLALMLSPVVTGYAFDSDTLGFYSFNDGEPGASAVGLSITNSVVGSAISSATVTRGLADYDAKFVDRRPAKLIYASSRFDAEVIAVNPGTIHIESGLKTLKHESKGTGLDFADAGIELSKHHDTGYTVEFFMQMLPTDVWYSYAHQIFLMAGYKDAASGAFRHFAMRFPFTDASTYNVGYNSAETPLYSSYRTADIKAQVGSFSNGLWHHVAFVERPLEGVIHFQTYVDGHLMTDYAIPAENISAVPQSSNGYFRLGRGNLSADISCVRFTASALESEDFMVAADSERMNAGEGSFAFYAFTGAEPGSSAAGVAIVNLVNPGRFDGAVTVNSDASILPFARFEDDVPGCRIYDGENGEVICENPRSLRVGSTSDLGYGGTLLLQGIGSELSRHHENGHTIEFFYKIDGKKVKNYELSMSVDAGYLKPNASRTSQLRLYMPFSKSDMSYGTCCLDYYGDTETANPCRANLNFIPAANDGDWHHVAIVETAEKRIAVYYDYVLCNSFLLGGVKALQDSQPFKFFADMMQGSVSCLRFTDHELSSERFLRAALRPPVVTPQPGMLAFYSFTDAASGSSADGVALMNDAQPTTGRGMASASKTAGANSTVTFDNDSPGEAIYGGEEYPEAPFVRNPGSLVFNSDVRGSAGMLSFSTLGGILYSAHATGFTLEYFVKFLDDNILEWDPCAQIYAGYLNDKGEQAPFNLTIPITKTQLRYLYGFGFEEKAGAQKAAKFQSPLWDGKWHHFAMVEKPVAVRDGEVERTNWVVRTWLDYKSTGDEYVISGVVDSPSGMSSRAVDLCRNKHHCKYSCVKVTARPLGVREFMRTKPRYRGLRVIVR